MLRILHKLFGWSFRFNAWFARRLTPAGMLVAAIGAAAMVTGFDTQRSSAYQVFCLCLGLLLVGRLAVVRFRPRVTLRRQHGPLASVGEPFSYSFVLENDADRPCAALELRERLADPRPALADYVEHVRAGMRRSPLWAAWRWQEMLARRVPRVIPAMAVAPLEARERTSVAASLRPPARGRLVLDGVWVSRRDPLGLVRGLHYVEDPGSVLVLPRRYPLPEIRLPGTRMHQQGGATSASNVADSEEFQSLRDYRPGDPLQHIHWKSFARTGRPIVKEFEGEFYERHALVLDTFAPAATGAFEEAVSVAASFASTVDTQESLLDLLLVADRSYRYTAGHGFGDGATLLEVLAHVGPARRAEFETLRESVLTARAQLTSCIVILIGWDDPRRQLIRDLRSRGLPVLALAVMGGEGLAPEPAEAIHVLREGHVAADLARIGQASLV